MFLWYTPEQTVAMPMIWHIMTLKWRHCNCTITHLCNRIIVGIAKRWHLVSMNRYEIFHVAWRGILHLLRKISQVYDTPSRLGNHSKLARFKKRCKNAATRALTPFPVMLICSKRRRGSQEREPVHSRQWLIQPYEFPRYFKMGLWQNWFSSRFLR